MVFEKIKRVIVEQLGIEEDEITLETTFEELGVDSLEIFQIVMRLKKNLNVQIEDAETIKTVDEAVKYVEDKIEE